MNRSHDDLERAAKEAASHWASEFLKPPHHAMDAFLQWNSDEEIYLGTDVYRGHKRLGAVVTTVVSPAVIFEQLGKDEMPGGPGTHEENLDWVYRWLRSDGEMGHSPEEALQDVAQSEDVIPKSAFKRTL